MKQTIKPIGVSDSEIAFGGSVDLLPKMNDIPHEFKYERNEWTNAIWEWFYEGKRPENLSPKPGIDSEEALRHIKAALRSFEPKHEHKMAGCAYLLSQFFEKKQNKQSFFSKIALKLKGSKSK
ncbi:hypothetical protein MOD24_16960 [Bacillus haynesii]|uniref:hypothetical protein n=1 Tax=Bacillus haynesii TaxID=1925021 RepID=UPI00227E8D47|nr:hypothetical protein [Bacillus haynesii]MCY8577536.1 hypothetical protein [Bacillus haynesii]MEC1657117.1 hypothetical protein [Bacillus haynesii]